MLNKELHVIKNFIIVKYSFTNTNHFFITIIDCNIITIKKKIIHTLRHKYIFFIPEKSNKTNKTNHVHILLGLPKKQDINFIKNKLTDTYKDIQIKQLKDKKDIKNTINYVFKNKDYCKYHKESYIDVIGYNNIFIKFYKSLKHSNGNYYYLENLLKIDY